MAGLGSGAIRRQLVIAAGVIVLASGGVAGAATMATSPRAWATTMCGSVLMWEQAIKNDNARMSKVLNSLQKTGHASLPQVKSQLVKFLRGVESATGRLLRSLKALGPSPGTNGGKIEAILVSGIEQTKAALASASRKAKALPTNNPTAFVRGTKAIDKTVSFAFSKISASYAALKKLSPAALKAAVKATHACKKLAG